MGVSCGLSGAGAFTMELVQPHMSACHTSLDIMMDVNNLYVAKDHTREIGFRVPVN